MSPCFCWGSFIEFIKKRYPAKTQRIPYFDRRKSVEKTNNNQLLLISYGIIISDGKKLAFDYSKLREIYGYETNDTYEIVIALSEVNNCLFQ
jgi:hypothetical protein